jgi:EmrB/QacA subfamily drug resistance transporter
VTAGTGTAPGPGPPPAGRLGPVVQYALLAGPLLSMLDSSIVNVAVAPIARELQAGLASVQWAVSGYLLAMGTGLAATAYLTRRLGTMPVYRASIIAFTVASAACAAAPDIGFLLAARAVQGLVAAPMVPLAMSMLLGGRGGARSMSPLAGILLFLGPALGPTVGGGLIGAAGWRSIFVINVPFGVAAVLAARTIPPHLAPGRVPRTRFDLPGLVLLAGGLTLLLLGATQGGIRGWGDGTSWVPLVSGAVLLAAYTAWAVRADQPALDLSLARYGPSALALALCALASVVTWAAVFLLPVFVQSVQGHSALATGLAMAPQGVVTGVSTALGQRVLTRISVRVTVVAGFAVLAVASLGILAIDAHTSLVLTGAVLACRAASIGLVITPLLAVLTQPLPPEELGDANTLINVWQRIAGSFGIGLIAALFTQQARAHGPVPALHTTGLLIAALSAAGLLAALPLPPIRNTALTGTPGGTGGPAGPGAPGSPHAPGPRRAAPGP